MYMHDVNQRQQTICTMNVHTWNCHLSTVASFQGNCHGNPLKEGQGSGKGVEGTGNPLKFPEMMLPLI